MRVIVLAALAACGPTVASTPKQSARDALVGDAARLEHLVRGGVTNGGLWFAEPACAAKFGKPGPVEKADLAAFAHCLAGLHLQVSTREDMLGDAVVLTSGPFELEARVVTEPSGPRLTWIGYEGQASGEDRLPTVSAYAIEKLRLEGTREGPLAADVVAKLELDTNPKVRAAFTWIKFCVDEYGAVTSAVPYVTTSLRAQEASVLAVLAWKFKPFERDGQPIPVCSLAQLAYPAGALLGETIPQAPPVARGGKVPLVLARAELGKRLEGTMRVKPDDVVRQAMRWDGKSSISGLFRICLDDTGHVESVLPLRSTGYASYDRQVVATMSKWVFAPYQVDGKPIAVCDHQLFAYDER